jgi:hypothetical protein
MTSKQATESKRTDTPVRRHDATPRYDDDYDDHRNDATCSAKQSIAKQLNHHHDCCDKSTIKRELKDSQESV